jgi:hypothetical protein
MRPTPPTALAAPATHPWIASLQSGLDRLEAALLHDDATGVQAASERVHGLLQAAPARAELAHAAASLGHDLQQAARRFALLRQAALRAGARHQRALHSLLPQPAPATYGPFQAPNLQAV